eukprot:CAMPEP_0117696868 /NCGR_PEP_ID=MMETSP0804-20121206/28905_1 /TAXON_ID=1074897 /ORGANISM="Tetraselmis astigmatica, Strain CCMP880" /LENGTH=44 /DNA_ID= /DNA_START= /DNA_END= /DNA_ORIENTATION=
MPEMGRRSPSSRFPVCGGPTSDPDTPHGELLVMYAGESLSGVAG